jgi:excinuclease ABC subunit C
VNDDPKKVAAYPREFLHILPKKPGVYLFRDKDEKIIYIGKARNIYNRVRSYFSGTGRNLPYMKPPGFIGSIKKIDYIVTSNEVEALILEGSLIKKYRPRYNIDLKDDKSYPFIAVTDEKYPRVFLTRNRNIRSAKYFGPYTDARAARKTAEYLRKVFMIRDCRKTRPGKSTRPPCLNYHMGLCSAPCTGNISEEDYGKNIGLIRSFLRGSDKGIIKDLEKKMKELSGSMRFEEAAGVKNIIDNIRKMHQDQRIIFDSTDAWDFIAVNREGSTVSVSLFTYRAGALALVNNFLMEDMAQLRQEGVISGFIYRYYEDINSLPSKIYVPSLPGDREVMEEWFKKKKNRSVKITVPRAGEKARIMDMAARNAGLYLKKKKFEDSTGHSLAYRELLRLSSILGLDNIPRRIECYDISNLGESFPAGSMSVALDGDLRPAEYRQFRIKTVRGQDDCAMLREVAERRLRYLEKESVLIKEGFYRRPDLMVVDGGKAQFGTVGRVLEEKGMEDIDLISIAKKEEKIFCRRFREGIKFDIDSEVLRIIIRLRDEAHRFAVGYHRKLRGKGMIHSVLDEIKGIGAMKKSYILQGVDSIEELKNMEIEDIVNIRGISYRDAVNIYNSLHR